MKLLVNLFKSLFDSPFVAGCSLNNEIITLEVSFKDKNCGYINISNEYVKFLISCGIKNFKGNTERKNVSFNYDYRKLEITNTVTNNLILKIKCSSEIYRKFKQELDR